MADEIPPALSAEEWAEARERVAECERSLSVPGPSDRLAALVRWLSQIRGAPMDPHHVAAVANAALPDGDRRKLTLEDAAAVLFGAVALKQTFAEHAEGKQVAATLDRLFHKLAAILPPPPDLPPPDAPPP